MSSSTGFFVEEEELAASKKKRRMTKTKGASNGTLSRHDLAKIKPKTKNQELAFEALRSSEVVVLYGTAGTGKTMLALYHALLTILDPESQQDKIIIVRSVVPTREIGFLPGTLDEKVSVYEAPYQQILTELTSHPTAYEKFKEQQKIEFRTTSFLRGLTFNNAVVIFDEFQSAIEHEIDTVVTRLGDNCKLILCGDMKQNDLAAYNEKSGFGKTIEVLKKIDKVSLIQFTAEDICRSGFVRDYIITKDKIENHYVGPYRD